MKWLSAYLPAQCGLCASALPYGMIGANHGHSAVSQLCHYCREQLPYLAAGGYGYCHGCGRVLTINTAAQMQVHCGACQKRPTVLDNVVVPCEYAWPMTHLIHQFKFGKRVGMATTFAQLIAAHWQERQCDAALRLSEGDAMLDSEGVGKTEILTAPDVFVPIALHMRRYRYRGYNQSSALAKALGRLVGVPVNNHVLERVRYTQPQHTLSFTDRKKAVRACFVLSDESRVRGAHIGLVDDVMTSGETLFAAAKLLKKHGAAQVSAWLIARTQW